MGVSKQRPITVSRISQGLSASEKPLEVSGWLAGSSTYLWIGQKDGYCYGTIEGAALYRLAESIVHEFGTTYAPKKKGSR